MALLLNIDTATEYAGVCLSDGENILAIKESDEQKNHATFVQSAIKEMLINVSIKPTEIDGISVTEGPGSYTGLRVGLSTAKGLCYALNKPLILINTLEVMAFASIEESKKNGIEISTTLFCPMIDARRLEVFTALYNNVLQNILPPMAMIINEHSFASELANQQIIFSGSGSNKLKDLISHKNVIFSNALHRVSHLAILSANAFNQRKFNDLAYSEPYYLKEFFNPTKK